MKDTKKYRYIAQLIIKEKYSSLDSEEQNKLELWLNNKENKTFYDNVTNKKVSKEFIYDKISTKKSLNNYYKKYKTKKLSLNRVITIAASILLVMSSLTVWITKINKTPENIYAEILPGESKALLILNNGKSIALNDTTAPQKINEIDKTLINTSKELISYQAAKPSFNIKPREIYNTLKIPKGGEFKLILADGTIIWLNSESTLKYPVNMASASRNVWLEGEAYFKVAENKDKPFYVHTDMINVKVLGTEFNIKSYSDDKFTQTVLVEGSVSMCMLAENKKSENTILKPGEMGYVDDKATEIKTKKVDTYLHTSWIYSQFVFELEPLENILKILSRWYNVEIVYNKDQIKNQKYTLDVKRYGDISTILNAIEATKNVRFEVKDKVIYVKK